MAGSQSRRGCGCSANRLNSSPLPKPSCHALTSRSWCSNHCRNQNSAPRTHVLSTSAPARNRCGDGLENTYLEARKANLRLRLWRRGLQSARADSPAASRIAAPSENRSREMIHEPELPWSDQDQQLRTLKRILPPCEQVSGAGDFSEARQAGDGASFLVIDETADHSCFVQLDTNRLRQRAIGKDGNSVHARSR